jgi:colanic acid/amylovoran biosynthesis glycosyltransferase
MAPISGLRSSIVMVHSNPVSLADGVLRVDRKFHLGMLQYARALRLPCVTVNPVAHAEERMMDGIEIDARTIPYQVQPISVDAIGTPTRASLTTLRSVISSARLVYGSGASYRVARAAGVPFVSLQEYDLRTQVSVAVNQTTGHLRRLARASRCAVSFVRDVIPEISGANAVHCNGYPFYDFALQHNPHVLLYLDSRMSADMVISEAHLEARLASLGSRRLRLLFSGRYERIKGADHAVMVAVECLRRGLDVELHCYGQGSLKESMLQIAAQAPISARIFIHDAIPYPDLAAEAKTFDLFICCHIQNDPSCTYLESLGSGLPIVGYANRMWQRLCGECQAGHCSPLGRVSEVASDIERIVAGNSDLRIMSRLARKFALEHCFESEFAKRVDALNEMACAT